MNQNTTNDKNDAVKHSQPIPITTRLRHRSASLSSDSSSSPSSPPPLHTPRNFPATRIPISPPSSPILSFLSQSPAKSSATAPFRAFGPPPVFEDDEEDAPATAYTRRGNTLARFNTPALVPEVQHERGVNLLRRLSLGSVLSKPQTNDIPRSRTPPQPRPQPNSAVTGTPIDHLLTARRARRSATITEPGRQRRAPSPMGERILKGHFDGFN
ncbi:hypothetical protein PAXRUDRAFT_143007 [Paxillus rubicundulus Ve08.2h10]|uniref:Uncharacterized protein n=1 Tax=Paxillus rubicundulus Ve08.2h10 TaxID=930991 RepID=A0A0D0E7V5_9AGAM|nr:hypothetical protein PAXRUDRAFT_143007 [Paxillus rubicundulus Ve08.2h10]